MPPRRPALRLITGREPPTVDQFLIVLHHTDPLVWRRIQVPHHYSFWDLHVAIQDAMGWLDCHLHEFTIVHPSHGRLDQIGIPVEGFRGDAPPRKGWEVSTAEYFNANCPPALYVYDFGDDWHHGVVFEGTWPAEKSRRYPWCVAGAGAGPPEDCGGPHAFAEFLEAMADPNHPNREHFLAWIGDGYDPQPFVPGKVKFADPKRRWKRAFEGRDP